MRPRFVAWMAGFWEHGPILDIRRRFMCGAWFSWGAAVYCGDGRGFGVVWMGPSRLSDAGVREVGGVT